VIVDVDVIVDGDGDVDVAVNECKGLDGSPVDVEPLKAEQ
jgi:hypothetical protein